MQAYLKDLLSKLKKFSASLDNRALFIDHLWLRIDSAGDRTLYVFRSKDDELLVIVNGKVSTHRWEYLAQLNSLLIKIGGEKALYRQGFLDEAVMILARDGTDDFIFLVNENKLGARTVESVLDVLVPRYIESAGSGGKGNVDQLDATSATPISTHEFGGDGVCRSCRTSYAYVMQTGYRCPPASTN